MWLDSVTDEYAVWKAHQLEYEKLPFYSSSQFEKKYSKRWKGKHSMLWYYHRTSKGDNKIRFGDENAGKVSCRS